jgi:2-oxoglutarate dehydrogenase E1 component
LKGAASAVEDFTTGAFRPVISDHENLEGDAVERVLLVSGRLYYDLLATRQKTADTTTAIVRVEQLYPLPHADIAAELAKYPNAEVVWAQDEPANQGPWPFMGLNLPEALDRRVRLVSRPASASTAAGSMKRHAAEQDTLLKQAFARK